MPATATAASSSPPAPAFPAPPADTDEPVFETSGPLSASEERVLKAVVVCVRRAAERGAPSTKPLDVELAVEPSGAVSDVRLGAGYSRDAAACVKREVVKLTFVARPQGGVEFVRYPIAGIEEEDVTDSSP
ncbi:MAG: hypothetical protein JNL21_01320 [Myxococcales bacterium]|nr:hypothetical protein [Myxococcales bacterium]